MSPQSQTAYNTLFTIQTDSLDRRLRHSTTVDLLPHHGATAPATDAAPRSHGEHFRAATQVPSLLPEHVPVPRSRTYSATTTTIVPQLRTREIEYASGCGTTSPPPLNNALLRRRSISQPRADEYRPSSQSASSQHVYHRYSSEQNDNCEPSSAKSKFSTQQWIQLFVLICIGYLVWDANHNVQLASARLTLYRQETIEADVRATQLYDMLHQLRKEFSTGAALPLVQQQQQQLESTDTQESNLLEETRRIQLQIKNLSKQSQTVGQELTSLQDFLDTANSNTGNLTR